MELLKAPAHPSAIVPKKAPQKAVTKNKSLITDSWLSKERTFGGQKQMPLETARRDHWGLAYFEKRLDQVQNREVGAHHAPRFRSQQSCLATYIFSVRFAHDADLNSFHPLDQITPKKGRRCKSSIGFVLSNLTKNTPDRLNGKKIRLRTFDQNGQFFTSIVFHLRP